MVTADQRLSRCDLSFVLFRFMPPFFPILDLFCNLATSHAVGQSDSEGADGDLGLAARSEEGSRALVPHPSPLTLLSG
jgi:hypothetical protein